MRLRIVGVLLAFVGLSVAGGAGVLWWLLSTEGGARFVIDRLVAASGEVLTAQAIEGTLASQVTLRGVVFAIEQVDASAESVTATLDLRALLGGRVVLRDLYASPLTVVPRRPERDPGEQNEPFEAVDLPVDIVLESVAIAGVVLDVGGTTYEFDQLTLTMTYADRVIDVTRFESRFRGFAFSTQARIDLADKPAIDATASVAGRYEGLDILVGARASGTLPALIVDAEVLEPSPLTASGPVILNAGPGVALDLAWAAPSAALLAMLPIEDVTIAAGTGRISGVPDEIAVAAATTVTLGGESVDVTADARYSPDRIDLVAAELRHASGVVGLSGSLAIAAADFGLRVDGRSIDPAWFVPGWEGSVDIGATLSGVIAERWSVSTDDLTASGTVRGQPFTAAGAGRYSADDEGFIERAELAVGSNIITARGNVGSTLSLAVDAELPELELLADGLGGVLNASLTATGSPSDPTVAGRISGSELAFGDARLATLSITGTGGVVGDATVDLDVSAGSVAIGGITVDTVTASLAGTAADHAAAVTLTAPDWQAASSLTGAISDDLAWRGAIDTLRYAQPPFGEWALQEPAAFSVAPGRIELGDSCLVQAPAELCVGLEYAPDAPGRLRVRATAFDLALLRPLLPEYVTASGRYEADIDVTGTRSSFVGRFHVAGGATTIGYAPTPDEAVTVMLTGVAADATIEPDSFESTAEIVGVGEDRVALNLSGARSSGDAIALDGRIDAAWAELAPLTIVNSSIGEVDGRLAAAIDIGGTFDSPQIDGRADLSGGRIELPLWGVVADSIEGRATSTDGATIDFDATGEIDGSALRLSGSTELSAAAGWPTRLNLSGDRVHLVQVADADVYVSPDLDVIVDLPRVSVAGSVTVPEALISIAELPEQAVRPSNDAIVHGDLARESGSPLLIDADIDLRLGEEVRYEGSGLFADLDGGLRLRYSTQTSANAAGTLSVTGRYEAFGQELSLERGELIFTGAIENPTLDIRAVRDVDEIRVGIDLTGTLQAPVSRMFSEPPMAEADALSYLLFGRPLAAPEGGDSDQLRNAALALGLRQAVPAIQRIGDTLGLDEFAIESTSVDAGELMAGKYLSPKLYVRYSYGLFNRIGGLLLQYQLNERFSIETRSGDQKSMDVLYTIERD